MKFRKREKFFKKLNMQVKKMFKCIFDTKNLQSLFVHNAEEC